MDRGELLAGLRALPTRNRIITALDVPTPAAAYDVAPGAFGNVFEIATTPTAGPWANFCKGTGCPP